MAEYAQRTDEKQGFDDHAGAVNDLYGFHGMTDTPFVPEGVTKLPSQGTSPRAFIDESSGLTVVPESPSMGSGQLAGHGLGALSGFYGAYGAYKDFQNADTVGGKAFAAVDGASSMIGGIGSLMSMFPGAPEALMNLAGPTAEMMGAELGAGALVGEATGAAAVGAGLGTVASLVGAFTGGYSVGSYADDHMKDTGLFGEGVGLSDAIGRAGGAAGTWVTNKTGSAGLGTAADLVTTGYGLSAGTMAAPMIAAHGLATGAVDGAVGLYHGGVNTYDSVQKDGVLPTAMNGLASIFGHFCEE